MNATVCELPNDPVHFEAAWSALAEHTQERSTDLVVLPEMPFSRWLAASPTVDADAWRRSIDEHEAWCARLPELGAARVIGTRPIVDDGVRFNEGFVWTRADDTVRPAHRKRYLPEEDGFWEARWYERGEDRFDVEVVDGVRVGFAICSEVWFSSHARDQGRAGADLLVSPRATLSTSTDKWIAGGRVAAVVSGAFGLSSNFSGAGAIGEWGGTGWIIDPEEGDVVGVTSPAIPFVTVDLDLTRAAAAKETYPRSVRG